MRPKYKRALPALALSACVAATSLALTPVAMAHLNDKEPLQSYRQSWFAMIAMNFGPMVSMVKGEIPWDERRMAGYADELAALATLDVMKGFAEGSEKGTTRAKPNIWENKADFQAKLDDMRGAVDALKAAANGTDRKAIAAGVAEVGGTCKACHDEYQSENYLY